MNSRGMTLLELMVVIAVVGILLVALGISYFGWKGRYDVERTIKGLYSSMSDARTRSLQTNRTFFVDFSANGQLYRVTDDDSNGVAKVADGDGVFQPQAAWAVPQNSRGTDWGAGAATTDATVVQLSKVIDLQTSAVSPFTGLLTGTPNPIAVTPLLPAGTVAFTKRGMITTPLIPAVRNDSSVCIFTDYDNNGVSDYDPDYDCINITQTKLYLGKLSTQNTAGGICAPSDNPNPALRGHCVSK
ncbi:MAG: prepilin-type N-terminal cleavage/methylation domain-containing protein [Thermodesulfovibrionales bacterium]